MPGTAATSRAADRRAFQILWFGQFAAIAGLTVVVPLLPFYLAGLGLPAGEVAWWAGVSLAAPAVTNLISAPLWGMVGDRYGHKAMVVRAHAGLAVAVGLMALADTPGEFLVCRLLQGACGGVVGPTATYASTLAAPHRRGRVLGSLFGATGAGCLLGPLVGSMLAGRFGYGALFACVAGLLLVAALLALSMLPHRRTVPRHRPEAGERPTLREVLRRIAAHPLGRTLVLAGMLGQAAVFALVIVFAPQVERITVSVSSATVWVGVLQATMWAACLIGGPWWGRRNDRGGAPVSFAIAAACCALAVALQGLPTVPEFLVPLRIVQGFCFAALAQSVLYVVCQIMPEQARGTALGTTTGLLDIGQVCGPLFGALVTGLLPLSGTFVAIGTLLVAASGLALLGARPRRAHSRPPATPVVPALPEVKP
ncbi:multidrug efflux MFS transporter [Streptomyces piniterrae]|uniref:Multidrug efflux MFS transporter n=1 Tax=Streptomyces piniterrae TaxID=2571125 RepID=A0A4V5MKQ2_9ACTN|nr:MFS transporter [Streptomyces piniterrae]TJZ54178.1 multidrug efflux MFS transporter [Streptomyces piniterrae]